MPCDDLLHYLEINMSGFDKEDYPFASRRVTTFSNKGMVAASQPLAAQAGLDILKRGGNAIDAAIAAAACLTVVEPTGNGIGGDAFALVWVKGQLYGLNSSGPAPSALTAEKVRALGYETMPRDGWLPVTVPGQPAGWQALSSRFGKLPLSEVLTAAWHYAMEGYPVSPTVARLWDKAFQHYRGHLSEQAFRDWCAVFAPEGRAPRAGELWKSPVQADALREIGATQAESFYRGALAQRIAQHAATTGGYLTKEDLAAFQPEWVEPIHAAYRGYDVWEIPPNGQGLITLEALRILEGLSLGERENPDSYHKQIESLKLAAVDGQAYITDSRHARVQPQALLTDEYIAQRRALISETAIEPKAGAPVGSHTVYLAAADADGNMISYIQSNYAGFGSGIVIPGTGIAMQNRGANFSLDPSHHNVLVPGKRTFHTIIPGFLSKAGQPVGPFGVMGGFIQPQAHLQVVTNTVDFGLNPQAALDAPRWNWQGGRQVSLEQAVSNSVAMGLIKRGHDIRLDADFISFGRGQIIWRDPVNGVLAGGSEPRIDGIVASW